MKTSARLRVWLMVTGVLLGLLASIGVAAPAGASSVAVPASHSHEDKGDHGNGNGDAELSLRIYDDGDYRVRGEGYEAKRVHVWIINVSRDRVVDHFRVRTDDGDFTVRGDDLKCGKTYKAVSYSRADGWVSSDRVKFRCDDDNGHGHH